MEAVAPIASVALPWLSGCSMLLAIGWPGHLSPSGDDRPAGGIALVLGYGYFIGLLVLIGWMRVLAAVGAGFGRWLIAVPLLLIVVAGVLYAFRRRASLFVRFRAVTTALLRPPLPRWQRIAWIFLLAWLALRFATLAIEVGSRPLYPWDAWAQWGPKARVWYELGRMVPFVPASTWLGGASGAYFDPFPGSPLAIPLLQAWSAVALGRWDDSAISWPWLFMLIALALAIYGMLRNGGVPPLGALLGAYLVSSLPLLDTHVALAGYGELMLTGMYTLSALALFRWASTRSVRDAVLAGALALACPMIVSSGVMWLLTLVPGAIVASWPARGLKIVTWIFGAAALALLALASGAFMAPSAHLEYASPWRSLEEAYLLGDNWHLLWCGAIVLAVAGGRRLLRPRLAPLTVIVTFALGLLLVATMFGNDLARFFPEARVPARAAMVIAPLIVFASVVVWCELLLRQAAPKLEPTGASDPALVIDA